MSTVATDVTAPRYSGPPPLLTILRVTRGRLDLPFVRISTNALLALTSAASKLSVLIQRDHTSAPAKTAGSTWQTLTIESAKTSTSVQPSLANNTLIVRIFQEATCASVSLAS